MQQREQTDGAGVGVAEVRGVSGGWGEERVRAGVDAGCDSDRDQHLATSMAAVWANEPGPSVDGMPRVGGDSAPDSLGFAGATTTTAGTDGLNPQAQGPQRDYVEIASGVLIPIDHVGSYQWTSPPFTYAHNPGNVVTDTRVVGGGAEIPEYNGGVVDNGDGTYSVAFDFQVLSYTGSPSLEILDSEAFDGGSD